MIRSRIILFVGAAMLGLSALAACGGSDDKPAAEKPAAAKKVEPCEPSPATLSTSGVDGLGEIVVNGECRTVYTFDGDTASPPKSNCVGQCELRWTPVPSPQASSIEGIELDLIGSIERPDGSSQITVKGWPIYYFAGDKEPGDVNGQGVGGKWWVMDTGGNAIHKKAADTSSVY